MSAEDSSLMPAEWEPHAATWLAFPHNPDDWPGKLEPIPWVYGEIIRRLAPGERIHLLVNNAAADADVRQLLARVGVDRAQLTLHELPTDRIWMRDSGPIFVRDRATARLHIARFRFNAWAKYDNWHRDVEVPPFAARALGVEARPVRFDDREVVLEGGAIDVNGAGTLLTTEECLLDPAVQVRNPGFGRREYEGVFATALGVRKTLWLGKGIAGDDTHGHVDDLARFVNPHTVVLCAESDPRDDNYLPLAENHERLQGAKTADGRTIEVVPLPMPQPLYLDGQRLPASYANFYIANAAVLVPTFNDPHDRQALGILSELFPDRPVIGIHAVDLVWGLGTLHCLSQQQPQSLP